MVISDIQSYLATKTAVPSSGDPVEDLRRGWDLHVELGLATPALYTLKYGRLRADDSVPAAHRAAADVLAGHIRRIAEAGRLRVPEALAAALVHAAGSGTTLALITTPAEQREPALSATAREAVIAAISTDRPVGGEPGPVTAAVALHAALPRVEALSSGEKVLLGEWLGRITA